MKATLAPWFIIGGLLGSSGSLSAQDALLVGRALDFNTEAPIAGARIDVVDSRGRRIASETTDSAGAFRFSGLDAGSYQLRARSDAYREVMTPPVELGDGGVVDVVVRLAVNIIPLAPLEVTARPSTPRRNAALSAFLQRAERGIGGVFIMPDEIERRSPRNITDLLATTAGLLVMQDVLMNQRTQCPPTVYLDGVRLNHLSESSDGALAEAFEAANLVPPTSLEGIEVYRGAATVPGEFGGSRAGCGVVPLWSKHGG
jgi:hypothetical protein